MTTQKGFNTLPELNVEYTFKLLPASRLTKVKSSVYRWFGQYDDKGRLLMFDCKNGDYFHLEVSRFSYLLENELICAKAVPSALAPDEQLSIFGVNQVIDYEGGVYEEKSSIRT